MKYFYRVVLILLHFHVSEARLCNNNLFGIGCRFQCHCKNNEQCDEVTGQCPSECHHNWAGPSCQYRNIALDYVFTEHSGTTKFSRLAVDGDVSTCTDVETEKSKTWWRVWLTNTYTITELEIIIKESYQEFFKQFRVTVEHVPKELATQTLNEYIVPKVTLCYENNGKISSTKINVVCNTPLKGNQVRIQLGEGETKLSLCDVRIFQGRNIAFDRRTVQSSDNVNGGKSLAAVDEKTSRELKVCSVTNQESNPWWSVDLAHVIVINRINITSSFENASDIKGYLIHVSNDSIQWNTVYKDTTTGSSILTNISIDVTARFVNVTLRGNKELRLCEVQILGDCLPNVCGFDCAKPCYCKTFSSHIKMSGKCPSGCQDRWTGKNMSCDTVAPYVAPPGVILSDVVFSLTILGITAVTSICITLFVLKRRQSSSSSESGSSGSRRNENQNGTQTGSSQLSRIRKRVLSLYYNTALRPKNQKSNLDDTGETFEYDDLEPPPRRMQGIQAYSELENKMKQLGKVKV